MNPSYRAAANERKEQGLPPLPLTALETSQLCGWLAEGRTAPPDGPEDLPELLAARVPAGVDPAARVKADFLGGVAAGRLPGAAITKERAIALLGTMQGGYNIPPLLALLADSDAATATAAARAMSICILAGAAVEEVDRLGRAGVTAARELMESWAAGEWFTGQPELPAELRLEVYKVDGEVNTDDLSPAREAPTRPDIPLHALSLGVDRFPGGRERLEELRAISITAATTAATTAANANAHAGGWRPVFVADTLGTGSSRKSATNSLVWTLGDDVPFQPNRRRGGVVLASRIAPIFYNSFEDAGGLPIRMDAACLSNGMRIVATFNAARTAGTIRDDAGRQIADFTLPAGLADSWRAGGRINLIVGRKLSQRAAELLGRPAPACFRSPSSPAVAATAGFTLAQKMVGRACGRAGVSPGEYCEPAMSTVGSQDTTGPMTRDELTALACLKFAAPMVMQSFCHTAAYPTDRDKAMQRTLPDFFRERGGLALAPGDGIIHSWLNRLVLPDGVGTGGDSHTRFPLGISFAAGSGLVALAAAMGFMPLEMPESVRVAFSGKLSEGLTLRDAVNAIPLFAMERGLVDRPGSGTANVFNGRIMEMEGLPGLTVAEAFELTCASAERSAAAATVELSLGEVVKSVRENVAALDGLLAAGYEAAAALAARKAELEAWLAEPALLRRDAAATFAAELDVDLARIREPVIACPNNPDLVAWLTERAGTAIEEVFIGSCMSSREQFQTAAAILADRKLAVRRLWITPPTRLEQDVLEAEGVLDAFRRLGARVEIPGCSLCMGNQARVDDGAAVFSTSTRNFDNRMGAGAKVYLGSAALAAVVAGLGRLPTAEEYFRIYRERAAKR